MRPVDIAMFATIKANDHMETIQGGMQSFLESPAYSDTVLICSDASLRLNKLIVGLLFPMLRTSPVFLNQPETTLLLPQFKKIDVEKKAALMLGIDKDMSDTVFEEWTDTIDNFIDNLKPQSVLNVSGSRLISQPSLDDERDFSESVLVVNEADQNETVETIAVDDPDDPEPLNETNRGSEEAGLHRTSVPIIADQHFRCPVCKIAFVTQDKVDAHVEVHSKKHKCSQCGLIFGKAKQLVEHSRTHSRLSMVQCDICEKEFTKKGLKLHTDRFHSFKKVPPRAEKKRNAKEIGKLKIRNFERENYNDNENDNDNDDNNDTMFEVKKSNSKNKRNVPCHSCEKVFTPKGFKLHSIRFHKDKVKKEAKTTKEPPKRSLLQKLFSCGFCEKKFSHLASMRVHEKVHTGGKPHKCDMCESKFSNKFDLYAHEKIHSAIRPYKCESCQETFKSADSLRFHTLLHAESQPRNCSYCDKSFKNANQLELHERVHIGEKPFVCEKPDCGMSFETATKLTRHITATHMTPIHV